MIANTIYVTDYGRLGDAPVQVEGTVVPMTRPYVSTCNEPTVVAGSLRKR